jgi:hypothetical protein
LVVIAENLEPGKRLLLHEIQLPGLTEEEVRLSLLMLEDGGFVTLDNRRGLVKSVEKITPAGRRAAGQWPSPDDLVPRLIQALEQVADKTTDPDQQGKLRQAAAAVGSIGAKLVGEVGARMIEHQMGL